MDFVQDRVENFDWSSQKARTRFAVAMLLTNVILFACLGQMFPLKAMQRSDAVVVAPVALLVNALAAVAFMVAFYDPGPYQSCYVAACTATRHNCGRDAGKFKDA